MRGELTTEPASCTTQPIRMLWSVYAPTLLFSVGTGAVLPIIPALASERGASVAAAALIAGCFMGSEVLADLPASRVVHRLGERRAMIWASLLAALGVLVITFAATPLWLALGVAIIGASAAVFALARHSYLTTNVAYDRRARAMSLIAGVFRAGTFLGPLAASALIGLTGVTGSTMIFGLVCMLAAFLTLLLSGRGPDGFEEDAGTIEPVGVLRTAREHRRVLLQIGSAVAVLSALRASRQVILPTWAIVLGVNAGDTALIIGVAAGVELSLFYVSGYAMDRFGRLRVVVPCVLGFVVAHFALALVISPTRPVIAFIVVTAMMTLANAGAGGIMMTIGADLAPPGNPATFLGVWRFVSDLGQGAAPLLIAVLTAAASINLAAGALGVLGLWGAGAFLRFMPVTGSRDVERDS